MGGGAASFRPGANSFQPGAQSFQPGQNFQQYGGYDQSGYQNQNFYQGGQGAQGYGGYPQYGQQGGYNNQYAQGGYNAGGYQQPAYNAAYAQQYPGYSQQPQAASSTAQQPPRQPPTIAKRPADGASSSSDLNKPVTTKAGAPKVLSIGGDAPKPKAKVLSIGTPAAAPAKKEAAAATPAEAGAKVTAAKAIEKTEKGGASESGKTSPTPSSGRSSPTRAAAAKAAVREVDAVEKEQAADVDDETLNEIYGKEHVNIIFIGHVDAGKSTLGGAILIQSGMVDERTIEKYKKEAKDMGRETWWISWALDLTKEERSKGKTVETPIRCDRTGWGWGGDGVEGIRLTRTGGTSATRGEQ